MKHRLVTTDLADTESIIKEFYEQFYTEKFNNLDEMTQLLKKHKLLQFTGYQVYYLNSTVSITVNVILKLLK